MMQRQELDVLLEKYDAKDMQTFASQNPSFHPSSSSSRREHAASQDKLRQLKSQIAELSETHSGLKYTIEYLKTSPSKLTKNKEDVMRLRAELADLVTYRVARDLELKEAYQKLTDEVTEGADAREKLVAANSIIELLRSQLADLKNNNDESIRGLKENKETVRDYKDEVKRLSTENQHLAGLLSGKDSELTHRSAALTESTTDATRLREEARIGQASNNRLLGENASLEKALSELQIEYVNTTAATNRHRDEASRLRSQLADSTLNHQMECSKAQELSETCAALQAQVLVRKQGA
jgi:chromosome segregation ATPase